jgi:uncharacterized membrane protein YozB (DUF420 family)
LALSSPPGSIVSRAVVLTIAAGAVGGAVILGLTITGSGLRALPTLNAVANATCGSLLIVGYAFIRSGRARAHLAAMGLALAASALFLASYLYYHAHAGSVRFTGQGPVRTLYFTILISHTILAAVVPPLAIVVVWQAARGRFERHRRIARWALPIWLYVSLTGVLIYLMLYVWFPA